MELWSGRLERDTTMPIITSTTVINVLNKDNVEYRIAVGSAMRVVKVRIFAATAQVQAYIERFDLTLEPLWLYEDEFEEVVRDAKVRLNALRK
jgi:hypothetical protein